MNDALKIIFMGTPDFAVPCLHALHKNGHRIELVVTQPDRPKGRGRKMVAPPVKAAAVSFGCDVLQPESIKTDEFFERIEYLKPDLFVVVAYGHILTERLLNIPVMGAVNIHASLLPKYRGSAPIQWAIINGEDETGVTSMYMDKGMDTGDTLLTLKEKIRSDDTSETLHDRLADLGGDLIIKTIQKLATKEISPEPQDNDNATYAPILKKGDGHIRWELPAKKIETFIRGMNPWPGAFTFLGKKRLKIFKTGIAVMDEKHPPGTVLDGFENELRVATGEGALSILDIQGESGKRLSIQDFLRGKGIPSGSVLN